MQSMATAIVAIAWSASTVFAQSSPAVPRTFNDLTDQAERIVVADAAYGISRRMTNGVMVTDFIFDRADPIKGPAMFGEFVVTQPGSTGSRSPNAPGFVPGTRYVLFVAGAGPAAGTLVGGEQGAFRVSVTPYPPYAEIYEYGGKPLTSLVTRTGIVRGARFEQRPAGIDSPIALDDFVEAIRKNLPP